MLRLQIRIPDIAQLDITLGQADSDKERQIMVFARPDDEQNFPEIDEHSDWMALREDVDFTRGVTP